MDPQNLEKQGFESLSQDNDLVQPETKMQENTPVMSEPVVPDPAAPDSTTSGTVTPEPSSPKKSNKVVLVLAIILTVLVLGGLVAVFVLADSQRNVGGENPEGPIVDDEQEIENYDVSIEGNGLNDFDLTFLKIENDDDASIVYSPLSIKYSLAMLNDGADGETKEQIAKVLGSYQIKNYQNSANLSIANAFFVNNAKKSQMLPLYEESLKKYNASVIYDDFSTPDNINKWIGDRTFGLINDLVENIDDKMDSFVLANTLAIDMEWKNKIQPTQEDVANRQSKYTQYGNAAGVAYDVDFEYENASNMVLAFYEGNAGMSYAATANRYDIINELGEENIRAKVQKKYEEWAQDNTSTCTADEIASQMPNLDEYVNTLSKHYGHLSSSTDFYFHDDENVAAFAKDLKTYDGVTLQYVAISPKDGDIAEYVKNVSAEDLNSVIGSLKNAEDQGSYEEGYVTIVGGGFDVYNFDYELKLVEDLKRLGIEKVFDAKAELDKVGTEKPLYIENALHKTNFAFSNTGIKAAAATAMVGGLGNANSCKFEYNFEVPKKEIRFNESRYLFLIRDKDSGEVWFMGLKNIDRGSEE